MPSNTSARGSASAITARSREPSRRVQRQSFPAPGLPCDAMYSTGNPSSRTTGAAADRVKKSGSAPGPRRRAIAIERVRWPRPVPFEVTNRIRSGLVIARSSSELLVGLEQGPGGVVSLALELVQGPAVAAPERPGSRPAGTLAPPAAPDLPRPQALLAERAHGGIVLEGEQPEQRLVGRLASAGHQL